MCLITNGSFKNTNKLYSFSSESIWVECKLFSVNLIDLNLIWFGINSRDAGFEIFPRHFLSFNSLNSPVFGSVKFM